MHVIRLLVVDKMRIHRDNSFCRNVVLGVHPKCGRHSQPFAATTKYNSVNSSTNDYFNARNQTFEFYKKIMEHGIRQGMSTGCTADSTSYKYSSSIILVSLLSNTPS